MADTVNKNHKFTFGVPLKFACWAWVWSPKVPVLDLLFLRYQNLSLIRTQNVVPSDYAKVRASILNVVEQWIKLHPEDWTQIKNKKCRQIVKKSVNKA